MKVKVWNGDQSKYLGEGTYEVNTVVYFWVNPNGSLGSLKDATQKPEPEQIPPGAVLQKSEKDNPMILMDDGTIRYGCQVWWEPVAQDVKNLPEPDMELLMKLAEKAAEKYDITPVDNICRK